MKIVWIFFGLFVEIAKNILFSSLELVAIILILLSQATSSYNYILSYLLTILFIIGITYVFKKNNLKLVEEYIMERSTISQAMLRVSELERIYRDKMYTMMKLENIVQEYILESDGTRYDCNEVVDFNREFELIIELGQEISTIKTNISKANNENYIETKTVS